MKINKLLQSLLRDPGDLTDFTDMTEVKDIPREKARQVQHDVDQKLLPERLHTDLKKLRLLYLVLAAVCAVALITVLLFTVAGLPRFGEDHEAVHEVADYYIENGLTDTGAVNIVAGMILDYRAFDTLGESFVLFTALNCVLILLRRDFDEEYEADERPYYDLTGDNILRTTGFFLVPSIILFGIYVMLNGHLSPGGGFSGGAIVGAGLIFASVAFGDNLTASIVTEKVFKITAGLALGFYCLAKSYSFFTGANHLESGIPLGNPGSIFSGGLILPLNVAVGFVVGFTMYGIYRMFRKGSLK